MKIRAIPCGGFDVNTYLISADESETVWVVDPADAEVVLAALEAERRPPAAILLTHGHIDHLHGLDGLLARHPVPVYMHPADAAWAFSPANCILPWYPAPPQRPAELREISADEIHIGRQTWKVLHTPGHTPGSVCLYHPESRILVSGDTLFREGVGRTDLPGGNTSALEQSLRALMNLPDDIRVLPGHGPASTIGHERTCNPFIRPLV